MGGGGRVTHDAEYQMLQQAPGRTEQNSTFIPIKVKYKE